MEGPVRDTSSPSQLHLKGRDLCLTKASSLTQLSLYSGFNSKLPDKLAPKRSSSSADMKLTKSSSWTKLSSAGESHSNYLTLHGVSSVSSRQLSWEVPECVRLEFHRYSTPTSGPRGRNNVKQVNTFFKFQGYIQQIENRTVNLDQLNEVYNYSTGNCHEWGVERTSLNFHELNKWVIEPATKEKQSSLSEHLVGPKMAPNWFVSHWWGELLGNFLKCIKQHLEVRGRCSHTTAYWVFAYAKRPNHSEEDVWTNPKHSSFYRALQATRFRTLLVLTSSDQGQGQGAAVPIRRLWCLFECAMSIDRSTSTIDIATYSHGSVDVMASTLTTAELNGNRYYPGRGFVAKIQREASFPEELIKACLTVNIVAAEASMNQDRSRMLNFIAGQDSKLEPLDDHDSYDQINRRLRSFFSMLFFHRVLASDVPIERLQLVKHMTFLADIAKAIHGDWWRTTLNLCLGGICLKEDEFLDLFLQSIPPNLVNLRLELQHTDLQDAILGKVAESLPRSLKGLSIDLLGCEDVKDSGMMNFIKNLPDKLERLEIRVENTSVSIGLKSLVKDPVDEILRWGHVGPTEQRAILAAKEEASSQTKAESQTKELLKKRLALENLLSVNPAKMKKELRAKIEAELADLERLEC